MITVQQAKKVIEKMENSFSSHDFIQKFNAMEEDEYVGTLSTKSSSHHQKVHSEIGRFLSAHMDELGIEKDERDLSKNVHGNETIVQFWKKTKS